MPQKKPVQNPHLAAQDGVRSDLLKAIRDGKRILEQLIQRFVNSNEIKVSKNAGGNGNKSVCLRNNLTVQSKILVLVPSFFQNLSTFSFLSFSLFHKNACKELTTAIDVFSSDKL